MTFALAFDSGKDAKEAVRTINRTFNTPAEHEGSALVVVNVEHEEAANITRFFKTQGYDVDLYTYEYDRAYKCGETGEHINVGLGISVSAS